MGKIKNFLIASEENNYSPGILKPTTLGLLAILFLIFSLANNATLNQKPASASDLTPSAIMAAVNNERTSRSITALSVDARLTRAAEYKAQDMISRRYFSHTDPEGNYIWGTIVANGYNPYLQLGENLAVDFSSTESLVAAWMNSPTHRANILNDAFKDQGMGVSFGDPSSGGYGSSIANTFGALAVVKKPAPEPPAPSPAPAPSTPPAPTPTPQPKPVPAPKPTPTPKPKPAQPAPTPTPASPAPVPTSTAPTMQPTPNAKPTRKISIKKDTLTVTADIKGTALNMDMLIGVEGQPDTVAASVGQYSALFSAATVPDASAPTSTVFYQGKLQVPLREAGTDEPVQIYAQDRYGQSDILNTSLQQIAQLPKPNNSALVKQTPEQEPFDFYKFNRYLALAIGLVLIAFMAFDVKTIVQRKIEHLDKKINNLVLLILSLLVIAALYWL